MTDFDGWTWYECGCGEKEQLFVSCAQHYFSYSGPVEHLAKAAHRKTHGVGSAWWDRVRSTEFSQPALNPRNQRNQAETNPEED